MIHLARPEREVVRGPRRGQVHRLDDTRIGRGLGEDACLTIGILAAVLGLLLAVAAIWIPRLVNRRNDPEYDADSRAYQKQTGRSARDIAQGNADQAFRHENDAGSQQAGGSDGPSHG
jgi:hypothetical protein